MIDFAALGVRDYLLIAAALAGAYLLFALLPLLGIGRRRPPTAAPPHDATAVRPEDLPDAADGTSAPLFSRELAQSSLELEVRRLRRELDTMRVDLARMDEEMRQLKAARSVAPVYSEAMILAQRGTAPAEIAAQCGISIGEAELVAALARSGVGAGPGDRGDDRCSDAGALSRRLDEK